MKKMTILEKTKKKYKEERQFWEKLKKKKKHWES